MFYEITLGINNTVEKNFLNNQENFWIIYNKEWKHFPEKYRFGFRCF